MVRVGLLALGAAIAVERIAMAAPCAIAGRDDIAIAIDIDDTTATLTFTKLAVTRVVTVQPAQSCLTPWR